MGLPQRTSAFVFDINLVTKVGETDFRNGVGSTVVGVAVGAGTANARRQPKVALSNRTMRGIQMVGQASALNFCGVFLISFPVDDYYYFIGATLSVGHAMVP